MTKQSMCHIRRVLLRVAFFAAWFACRFQASANPTGGTVTQGSASITGMGSSQVNINQTSANAFINWQTFNIAAGETTTFNQPSATSITWNYISDPNASSINGNINANGLVVLQNPNGFAVGGSAAITAHGLIMTTASTPAINLSSSGPWSFCAPPPTAKIINYGQINITGGGTAYLIADDIENNGTISAPAGAIGLYAGQTVLVSTAPDGRGLSAQATIPQGLVDNNGNLVASAGSIALQAQMVNQNGLIQANSAQSVNGTIELVAGTSLNLGASSVISANGDPNATAPSPGGFAVLNAGNNTFADTSGSTISVSGTAGGQNGVIEIFGNGVTAGTVQSAISGYLAYLINPDDIFLSTSPTTPNTTTGALDSNPYANLNVNDLSACSQIDLQALNNIELSTILTLAGQLSLTAGNNITLDFSSGINAGSVNLTAGTGFVPATSQPKPTSGSDGIYLDFNPDQANSIAYIQSQNGNINLWAANEVQVGWSGATAGPGLVNPGEGSITTVDGGNINVTTEYGDVNAGSDPAGYVYSGTAPYTRVASNLGGIGTADGGNVTIAAGGNVISYLPSGNTSVAAEDGGVGSFGPGDIGNVTITAVDSVYGHYVVADGTGDITAGQNVGAANGNPFALSLISGGWSVNAPNGDIYLQEVRNPNGDFNNNTGRNGLKVLNPGPGEFLFTYSPQDHVDLTANGVYLTSLNVPRLLNDPVPVLYPSILDITAGSGGVTLEGDVTLFPSSDQNLDITITDGGNFTAADSDTGTPYYLMMSDSALSHWTGVDAFSVYDHGTLQDEPNESTPVLITISGSMENLDLITTKVTDITVGGDMDNCGFSGQNLQASDVTTITVAGQIYNTSAYSFVSDQAIPNIPASDLLTGMANSWNDIFTLAVNPALLESLVSSTPASQISQLTAASILESAGLFQVETINGQSVGVNPGFVYNSTTGQLGFAGPMTSATLSALTQPITVLHLVNGLPVLVSASGTPGTTGYTPAHFETDTISWASSSAITSLYQASNGLNSNGNQIDPPAPSLSDLQLGDRVGGPGSFDINAGSISLGNSYGFLSCGDYDAAGGFDRYGNLASITPEGATVNVTVSGDLSMLTSTIAALGGGDVNVISTGGSMDLGSPDLFATTASSDAASAQLAFGIYTTGGGDVNVTALGDVDIDGSRIASYNGGNIFVESLQGDVNVGDGTADLNTVYVAFLDPFTGQATSYQEDVFGSGIIANTLVPASAGVAYPPGDSPIPGNITVETPQGDIVASTAGILQEALDGSIAPGPTVTLDAGTPNPPGDWASTASPLYVGNIDLGNSGVIGGAVNLSATGNIIGQIVSRQNSTVTAGQSFSGTLLAGGSADVTGGGTITGTIVGVGGATVTGANGVTASVLGQNVSVNGAQSDTLGSSATATSATQSSAQQASQNATQQVASDANGEDDQKKEKKKATIHVGRVTVILSAALPQ